MCVLRKKLGSLRWREVSDPRRELVLTENERCTSDEVNEMHLGPGGGATWFDCGIDAGDPTHICSQIGD